MSSERKKIMLRNHWSKKSPEEQKKIKEKISRAMEKYHRDRLTKLPINKS